MEMSDIIALREFSGDNRKGMSDYETAMLAHKQGNRANGATVTAIVLAGGALIAGLGAWGFSCARSRGNEMLINANSAHNREIQALLANQISANRLAVETKQAAQDSLNINFTQSSSQSQSVQQSAIAQAEAQLLTQSLLGNVSCGQRVQLYSPAKPFECGCTCG